MPQLNKFKLKRQNSAKGFKEFQIDEVKHKEFIEGNANEPGNDKKNLRELMDDLKMWKTKFSNNSAFEVGINQKKKTPDLPFRLKLPGGKKMLKR
jgi:hypothetical protein